jgi:cell division protein FtsX
MSTAHAQEIAPDSMAGGFTRLFIVVILALVAALVFYSAALPLRNSENKHRNEVTINVNLQALKA